MKTMYNQFQNLEDTGATVNTINNTTTNNNNNANKEGTTMNTTNNKNTNTEDILNAAIEECAKEVAQADTEVQADHATKTESKIDLKAFWTKSAKIFGSIVNFGREVSARIGMSGYLTEFMEAAESSDPAKAFIDFEERLNQEAQDAIDFGDDDTLKTILNKFKNDKGESIFSLVSKMITLCDRKLGKETKSTFVNVLKRIARAIFKAGVFLVKGVIRIVEAGVAVVIAIAGDIVGVIVKLLKALGGVMLKGYSKLANYCKVCNEAKKACAVAEVSETVNA